MGDMILAFTEPAIFFGYIRHLYMEELISRTESKCCMGDIKYML